MRGNWLLRTVRHRPAFETCAESLKRTFIRRTVIYICNLQELRRRYITDYSTIDFEGWEHSSIISVYQTATISQFEMALHLPCNATKSAGAINLL